jgi:hypothetical protein
MSWPRRRNDRLDAILANAPADHRQRAKLVSIHQSTSDANLATTKSIVTQCSAC